MKLSTLTAAAALLTAAGMTVAPAGTSLLDHGITYTLEQQPTTTPGTHEFALTITGENTTNDTEGGVNAHRTGINAIAFNMPSGFVSTTMVSPLTGFTFITGGLNSSGCNGNGNFFCFDNTNIPPIPTTDLTGKLVFVFDVQATTESNFTGYAPDFKIDWVGPGTNNFDLVSKQIIPDSTCPDCTPTQQQVVSEPDSSGLLGTALAGLGLVGFIARRRRRDVPDACNYVAA
jgi:MYXO-CTERM domain-containing protein